MIFVGKIWGNFSLLWTTWVIVTVQSHMGFIKVSKCHLLRQTTPSWGAVDHFRSLKLLLNPPGGFRRRPFHAIIPCPKWEAGGLTAAAGTSWDLEHFWGNRDQCQPGITPQSLPKLWHWTLRQSFNGGYRKKISLWQRRHWSPHYGWVLVCALHSSAFQKQMSDSVQILAN